LIDAERSAHRRVLIVDDDPELVGLITDGLELAGGYEVMAAQDGASGFERFFDVQPDCVVVDVRMPGLDGYQFVRALRGDPTTAQTPVIVLSALVQDQYAWAGLVSGADMYLLKPVKMTDLLQAIRIATQITAAERQQRLSALLTDTPDE
jgi:two-component system alkaline phosphatase synthesis response regulator PhoP